MEWTNKQPVAGDMIRVRVSFYYHYGIYENDETVYAFGLPDNTGTDPEEIEVLTTDIATFLHGGMCECGKLSFKERRKAKKPAVALAYAREHLGMRGYNILHHNCEHFANACLFGEDNARSFFVDGIRQEIKNKL